MEVDYPYPLLFLTIVDGNELILTSVSTRLCIIIFSVEEALVTKIPGASYPNDHLYHPNLLNCCHGWNFPRLSGSVHLPQMYLHYFTQCDTLSFIIVLDSSSSSEAFWVTTLICLSGGGGGRGDLHNGFIGSGVSLSNTFSSLLWWGRIDSDISIDLTLSNQCILLDRGRRPRRIRFSDGKWRVW